MDRCGQTRLKLYNMLLYTNETIYPTIEERESLHSIWGLFIQWHVFISLFIHKCIHPMAYIYRFVPFYCTQNAQSEVKNDSNWLMKACHLKKKKSGLVPEIPIIRDYYENL